MKRDAAFYFANLGADVARCVQALRMNDEPRYQESLERAHHTLAHIRTAKRPEAYEEALLMLRALEFARATPETLMSFKSALDSLVGPFSRRFAA